MSDKEKARKLGYLMTIQPIQSAKGYEKPIKIIIAAFVVILGMFIVGAIKDVPVYEVRKEVTL